MRRIRAVDLVDVLAYIVVLGVFVELLPRVISESFLVTVLTAILLKGSLELVVRAKKVAVGRLGAAETFASRSLGAALLVLVSAGSKLFVLWLTDLVLGDRVYLGGFLAVTALIVTLMLARAGVRRLVAPES